MEYKINNKHLKNAYQDPNDNIIVENTICIRRLRKLILSKKQDDQISPSYHWWWQSTPWGHRKADQCKHYIITAATKSNFKATSNFSGLYETSFGNYHTSFYYNTFQEIWWYMYDFIGCSQNQGSLVTQNSLSLFNIIGPILCKIENLRIGVWGEAK